MDRLTEMEAFATVVDQGGFTDAAKKMGDFEICRFENTSPPWRPAWVRVF